jgi:restriction endonuclease Mrr
MPTDSTAAILTRLRALPFGAFVAFMARLLARVGYESITPSGRDHWKGRNGRDGNAGYDLTAVLRHGASSRHVVVQAKQFTPGQKVYRRTLDELRGVALRVGVGEALLVTTGTFSPAVDRQAFRDAPILPVATLDGDELAVLLLRHRVGLTRDGRIDEPLLRRLEAEARGNGPGDCLGPSEIVVTVGVRRVPRREVATRTDRS